MGSEFCKFREEKEAERRLKWNTSNISAAKEHPTGKSSGYTDNRRFLLSDAGRVWIKFTERGRRGRSRRYTDYCGTASKTAGSI